MVVTVTLHLINIIDINIYIFTHKWIHGVYIICEPKKVKSLSQMSECNWLACCNFKLVHCKQYWRGEHEVNIITTCTWRNSYEDGHNVITTIKVKKKKKLLKTLYNQQVTMWPCNSPALLQTASWSVCGIQWPKKQQTSLLVKPKNEKAATYQNKMQRKKKIKVL